MERALRIEQLELALGGQQALPSPGELARLVGEAEIALLLSRRQIDEGLESLAWYLHAIGSAREALDLYGVDRQRAALAVAGHIFDLVLRSRLLADKARLELVFACQTAYLGSTLDPNALAIYGRELRQRLPDCDVVNSPSSSSLALGNSLLALDSNFIFDQIRLLDPSIRGLEDVFESSRLSDTPYAAAVGVMDSVRDLHVYLVYGRSARLETAVGRLSEVASGRLGEGDPDSRWVAAHLLRFSQGLPQSSIWTVLPPAVPDSARRAFTQGSPRVATLWPPQVDVLGTQEPNRNPLSAEVRRLILSMPTSSGKTLLAQLLITSHLASRTGGVCYVGPTRSLCNEVRRSLESRLRYMDLRIGVDLPDFLGYEELGLEGPTIEVMTPERLMFLLRRDAESVLSKFSLFIFDEAHNVADSSRGWTLESLISFIHAKTTQASHKIVLMSAAIGNRSHFVSWLSVESQEAVSFSSAWRGPRRLHCVWTTDAQWSAEVSEPRRSADYPIRLIYPIKGVLHARTTRDGQLTNLATTDPIGQLAFRATKSGKRENIERDFTTAFYRMLVPLVELLVEQGPVLVVEDTRAMTIRMAQAIASERGPDFGFEEDDGLVRLIEARLGQAHPLTELVARGVAYHHGSLPLDIRAAIEDAIRAGRLDVLVATTSLTEGVNLPVHSVVVGSQGQSWQGDEGAFITGPRLLNAVGRAGRATLETEGVVVLARQASFSENDFDRLDPPAEELAAYSPLSDPDVLIELASLEEATRVRNDAVLEVEEGRAADFVSFIWFLAAERERSAQQIDEEAILSFLERTLAWQQIDESGQRLLSTVSSAALSVYRQTEGARRRRWATGGATIPVATRIDEIAAEIATLAIEESELASPVALLERILGDDRLEKLLSLPGVRTPKLRMTRGAKADLMVDLFALVRLWLQGAELPLIGETLLSQVSDEALRMEQLADIVGELLETNLPWSLGLAIAWANERRLGAAESLEPIPPELTAYLRWGVSSSTAVSLLATGIQSRRLANAIADTYAAEPEESDVFTWLRTQTLDFWREAFGASATELLNLLRTLRLGTGSVATVLEGGVATFEVTTLSGQLSPTPNVTILQVGPLTPPSLVIESGGTTVARVATSHHSHLTDLVETGLELDCSLVLADDRIQLAVRLASTG